MCFECCWKRKEAGNNGNNKNHQRGHEESKGGSVWEVLGNRVSYRMSSWSLPKSSKNKEEFEERFDKYLALEATDSEETHCNADYNADSDSNSSTLSKL